MCDERERLLDYLYDACDADERRTVERHLETCDECRTEISELRAVRLNLLAWRVPEHESVWTPFAPARVRPWYREVPAWALAAAASVTFFVGLAGGLASRAVLSAPALAASASPAPAVVPQVAVVGASRADLDALEHRILQTVRTEVDQRVTPLAAHAQSASATVDRDDLLREMRRLVATSEERQREMLNANILNWLRDSQQTFVTNRQFNTWRKDELGPSVHSALVAFQQSSK